MKTVKCLNFYEYFTRAVFFFFFLDGTLLVSGGGDAKCKLFRFDKKSLEEVRTFEMDERCQLWAAGFSPDEQYIACSGHSCQNAKYGYFSKIVKINKCPGSEVFFDKKFLND